MTAQSATGSVVDRRALLLTVAIVSVAGVLLGGLFSVLGSEAPEKLGWDFRMAYYPAGEAVADGQSPYPVDPQRPDLDTQTVYAYPPQLAILVAPLTVLPENVAAVVAVLASFAALMGALALVGMRDIRCYAALVVWAPGWNALEMANVSALLALLLAIVWRFRENLWPLAAAMGLMVSLKLFLWPVVAWAAMTKRLSSAVLAIVIGLALTLTCWALIGFAGLGLYPELLERVAKQESYSIKGVAAALGLGSTVAYVISFGVVAVLLGFGYRVARAGDEKRAFVLAVLAALAVSPIVWLHYLVLLAVPLAVVRPRFSLVWLLPAVLWLVPRSGNGDGIEPFVAALVVVAIAAAMLTRTAKLDRVVAAFGR